MSESITRETNGHFAKGNQGGPGRPRTTVSRSMSTLDEMGVEIGKQVFQMIADKALAGYLKAAELLLSRVWPNRRGRPLDIDARRIKALPDYLPAASDVTNAVLGGEVTPQEGREMSALLRTQCEAITLIDFDQRLSEIEKYNEQRGKPIRGRFPTVFPAGPTMKKADFPALCATALQGRFINRQNRPAQNSSRLSRKCLCA